MDKHENLSIYNQRIKSSNIKNKSDQKKFGRYILRVGEGLEKTVKDLGEDIIKLPNDICIPLRNMNDLIEKVFDNFEDNYYKTQYIMDRVILATTNKVSDKINSEILNLLPSEKHTFYSADSTNTENDVHSYPV
jgi:hypothetical protein